MQTFEVECVDRHDAKPYTVRVSADSPEQAAERAAQVHVVAGVRGYSARDTERGMQQLASDMLTIARRQSEWMDGAAKEMAVMRKHLEIVSSRVKARTLSLAIALGIVLSVPLAMAIGVMLFFAAVALGVFANRP